MSQEALWWALQAAYGAQCVETHDSLYFVGDGFVLTLTPDAKVRLWLNRGETSAVPPWLLSSLADFLAPSGATRDDGGVDVPLGRYVATFCSDGTVRLEQARLPLPAPAAPSAGPAEPADPLDEALDICACWGDGNWKRSVADLDPAGRDEMIRKEHARIQRVIAQLKSRRSAGAASGGIDVTLRQLWRIELALRANFEAVTPAPRRAVRGG